LDVHSASYNAIVITLTLMASWILFYWVYAAYRRDLLRDRLFAIRGSLFDLAAHGDIDFDHAAYGALRTTLNGFLRMGHKASLLGFVLITWRVRPIAKEFFDGDHRDYADLWSEAIVGLDEKQVEALETIRIRMHAVLFAHVIATSLIAWVTVVPIVLILIGRVLSSLVLECCRRYPLQITDELDSSAYAVGRV